MTTHLLTPPETIRDILYGPRPDAATALHRDLDRDGLFHAVRQASGGLARAAQDELDAQIVALADQALGVRAVDLITAGWRKHQELAAAAEATAAAPERTLFVSLAEHRITSTHTWTLDIVLSLAEVADKVVMSIDFALTVTADVEAILLVVRDGHLIGIRGADCDIRVTLTARNRPIIDQHAHIHLGAGLTFEPGIALRDTASENHDARAEP
jgi:hypothetical protein